jgi:uncharacterized protein YcgI (DUF1989 family)
MQPSDSAGPVSGRVLLEHVIPAREFYALEMRSGQTLRVIDLEGQQVMDYVAFNAHDHLEKLSMVWTNVLNRTWKITRGHELYSNRAAPMFTIVEDTVQMNYSGGGFCTEEGNFVRYGVRGTRTCAGNLTRALAPYGIERKDLDEACCFNIFMNVAYDPDGTFEIRAPISRPGDYMDLEARMDVLVGMSCCPQDRNPGSAFNPTPMKIILSER